jgi:hypothetical protein
MAYPANIQALAQFALGPNPAPNMVAVVPSNSADLIYPACRLYVGTAGDVAVYGLADSVANPAGQTPVVFKNVNAGQILPILVARVLATNTTASNIVALY